MKATVDQAESPAAVASRVVPRRTRIDAPHPVAGSESAAAAADAESLPAADPVALGRAMLEVIEEPPTEPTEVISIALGEDLETRREQLQLQAAQLAEHLRERLREVDRREAQLNARVAQLESEVRTSRLWFSEREHEFQEHEAEYRRQLDDLQSQRAGQEQSAATADEDRQSRHAELRQREEECRRKELELRERRQETERQATAIRHSQQVWEQEEARQQQALVRDRERLAAEFAEQTARRDQAWQAREQLLRQHAAQIDHDRAALLADRQAWEAEKNKQRKILDEEAQRAAAEETDRRQRLDGRQEWIERQRSGLDTVRAEILSLHRQSLEMRLIAEQLWSQISGRMTPADVTQAIAGLRLKLAEHYQIEEQSLQARKDELVALGEKIAEQHRELSQLRDGVKSWAAARQQEIEQQASRLVNREIELDAQQEELRQTRHAWQAERRSYEQQIRELMCQVGAVPAAA